MTTEQPTDPRRAASRARQCPRAGMGVSERWGLPGDEGQGETPPPILRSIVS